MTHLCWNLEHCEKEAGYTCGKCKIAHYCSVACQRQHREVHKRHCGEVLSIYPPYLLLCTVSDEEYPEISASVERGEPYIVPRPPTEPKSHLIVRCDGRLYETPTGIRVAKQSEVNDLLRTNMSLLPTYTRLGLLYGMPSRESETFALFIDRKEKIYHLLNKKEDKVKTGECKVTTINIADLALA